MRELDATKLADLGKIVVFQGYDSKRLAVLVPYEMYVRLQALAAIGGSK